MKKFFSVLLLLLLFSTAPVGAASTARSVVETQIEGEGEVYQSVETTVNGQTVKKESTQPGKLELEMKKEGENEPTVTFSQESSQIITSPTPQPKADRPLDETPPLAFVSSIIDFVRNLLSSLTAWFK